MDAGGDAIDNIKIYWLEDFIKEKWPYEPIIEDGILAIGEKMIIAGPSEAGKSFLALQLAMELATEGEFFERRIVRPSRVLIFQAEVLEGEYALRTAKLAANYDDLENESIAIITSEQLKLNEPDGEACMAEAVERVEPDVVIIDPLRAFFSGDENDSAVGDEFFTALGRLQEIHPFTFIGLHHVRKPSEGGFNEEDFKYMIRGSGIWTDRPSTILGLIANAAQTEWKLIFAKTRGRSNRPDTLRLRVNYDTGLFEMADGLAYQQRVDRVLDVVGDEWQRLSSVIALLQFRFEKSRREVERWLTVAERERVVEKKQDETHRSRVLIRRTPEEKEKE